MGVWEVITGQQPLMKPVPAGRSTLPGVSTPESEIEALINKPFVHKPKVNPDFLHGTLDTLAASKDYELAKRGSGDLQSIRALVIPVTTTGEITGSPFQLGECTGILLAPRVCGDNGLESESSDTARIYVQINNCGVWIPLSFNLAAQGSQKGDAQFIAGPIATLRIQVVNVTQDPANQPNVYLLLMRGVTIVGQFGAAVGYGPPIAVSSAGSATPVTVAGQSAQGGSTPGGSGGAPGGGGGPGGGGVGSGGGGGRLR